MQSCCRRARIVYGMMKMLPNRPSDISYLGSFYSILPSVPDTRERPELSSRQRYPFNKSQCFFLLREFYEQ